CEGRIAAMAQAPALLEPADVADFPQRRVHDGETRTEELRAGEVRVEREGPRACARERRIEPRRVRHGARRVCYSHRGEFMKVSIVTPASAHARSGNHNTAARWAHLLRELGHRVVVEREWRGQECDAMIALHAKKSHSSIARFAAAFPERPLIVALTGTDLYRDIHSDASAQASLSIATRLIVLQELGGAAVPAAHRHKVDVVYQSARKVARPPHLASCFEVIVSGHLREEKD